MSIRELLFEVARETSQDLVKECTMPELPVSRKFLYDLDELYTKRKTKEITEEEFSIQRDALLAQEAKSHEAMGQTLIVTELESIESGVANTVNQRFQKEEQEESERAARDRLAKIAEQERIAREERAKQKAIEAENNRKIAERNMFRADLDGYIGQCERNANRWQIRCNWLQIITIVLTKDLYLRIQAGSCPTGTNQRETHYPGGPRARHFGHVDPPVAQGIGRSRRRSLSRQWASDRPGGGTAPSQTRIGGDPPGA
jgi:hypothetical protein